LWPRAPTPNPGQRAVRTVVTIEPNTKERIMISARGEQRRRLSELREFPLLGGCTAKELARVDRLGTEVDLQPGRTLTREGAEGGEFFMVRDGVAVVTRRAREVGAIGAGSVAGELALLDGTVRTATVVTATPMRVVVFTAKEFDELLNVAPCIENGLALIAAGRRVLLEAAPWPSHHEAAGSTGRTDFGFGAQ
jgi:CRP/FNR family cyclic AMP-dependent transcriptional regulator